MQMYTGDIHTLNSSPPTGTVRVARVVPL
jgi:hypothetical protein